MCGRFFIDISESEELGKIIANLDKKIREEKSFAGVEIYPSAKAVVLEEIDKLITPAFLTWGYPGFQKSKAIINARSETAEEKPMFQYSVRNHRCIIPANGFFEWNRKGNMDKYYFSDKNADTLYMAGLYKQFEDGDHFVILTTAANGCMEPLHDRMPLILKEAEKNDWLYSTEAARFLLHKTPPILERRLIQTHAKKSKQQLDDYEQLTFNF
ncbi:MAG: SOS response-associated peptidase [Lachnospiraceae bacterium]